MSCCPCSQPKFTQPQTGQIIVSVIKKFKETKHNYCFLACTDDDGNIYEVCPSDAAFAVVKKRDKVILTLPLSQNDDRDIIKLIR